MKIVFMGTPDFARAALEALIEAGHEITAVVTQPDKAKGRSKELIPTPVKACALENGIPVLQPRRIKRREAIEELKERFVLIYTGQRRLARNLLREVVGGYIGSNPNSIEVLYEIQRTAVLMKFELEKGNIDGFAELLERHWELSKRLDGGSTNTCIDQIFLSCQDLLAARMICGAGGGGFLQAILKKGCTKEELRTRIRSVFQDSGVDVWDCEIVF